MFKKLFMLVLLLIVNFSLQAQDMQEEEQPTRAKYYQDFLNFASDNPSNTRLDVFIQVPYKEVQFVISDKGYTASYTVTISIYDENKDKLISDKVWTEKIDAFEFDNTNAKGNFNLSMRSFYLKPGKYFIRTSVEDKESKKSFSAESMYTVKDFSKNDINISDIMIISKQTPGENSNKIIPNISRNVSAQKEGVPLFFEVYSAKDSNVVLDIRVMDEKQNVIYSDKADKKITAGKNQLFYTIKDSAFSLGKYLIELNVKNSRGETFASTSKSFYSRWIGAPTAIQDLDKAVDQLIYIATEKELDYIKDAPNKEEKQKRYVEFWKKKDPAPSTEENEVFDEYYRRIEYSNKNFSHYTEGWKTDRGMVFIILGAPNSVDRHPFDYDAKPYEVWEYFQLNRRFVFLDETGFGDYRLITPLYGDDYRYR